MEFIFEPLFYIIIYWKMARQISLILVATLFLTLFTYHRSLFQLAPHLLHHLLLDTPFSSLDPPSPLDIEALN